MNRPEMIIFDYGHTLLCEPDWDPERGNREFFKYITANPNGVTVEDFQKTVSEVFGKIQQIRESHNCDICARVGNRIIAELLNLEFSLTPVEWEIVFWSAATPGAVMPYADKMLDFLNENKIRTAVISNIGWSGEALAERINRLLPDNKFEFIIASSDYMYRKPSRVLFDIALNKAELTADKVWYCGDSIAADVFGAHGAGIYPVLYDDISLDVERHHFGGARYALTDAGADNSTLPNFDYLHIHDWRELIDILKKTV